MLVPIPQGFRIAAIYDLVLDRVFARDMTFSGEAHDFYELVYVESGKIEVTEEEEIYLLGEGDLVLHAPMEFHRIRSAGGTEPHVLNLSFSAEGVLPPALTSGVLSLGAAKRAEFLEVFRFAAEEWHRDMTQEETADELAVRLKLFLLHLGDTRGKAVGGGTAPEQAYRTLIRLLNEEVESNLTLEEIAARSFLSVSYIKALFGRYAGIGPRSYYNALRLQVACRRLDEGYSVAEVSERMHFSSPNNFIRFFKKKLGITPLQYKKGD